MSWEYLKIIAGALQNIHFEGEKKKKTNPPDMRFSKDLLINDDCYITGNVLVHISL